MGLFAETIVSSDGGLSNSMKFAGRKLQTTFFILHLTMGRYGVIQTHTFMFLGITFFI
jgi:hypothetical protein